MEEKKYLLKKMKVKDHLVIMDFVDFNLKFSIDSYAKYKDFVVGETYLESEINELIKESNKFKVRRYIAKLILRRDYSSTDIIVKVHSKYGDIEYLDEFLKEGLNTDLKTKIDKDFIREYLYYLNANNYGKYYILNFFRKHGIGNDVIANLKFSYEEEKQKCYDYFKTIEHKYVSNNYVKQKRKLFDVLLLRGFDTEIINDILDELQIDKDAEYQKLIKDYNKLKNKYSKKYDKAILKDKIFNALINKGYSYQMVYEYVEEVKEEENV